MSSVSIGQSDQCNRSSAREQSATAAGTVPFRRAKCIRSSACEQSATLTVDVDSAMRSVTDLSPRAIRNMRRMHYPPRSECNRSQPASNPQRAMKSATMIDQCNRSQPASNPQPGGWAWGSMRKCNRSQPASNPQLQTIDVNDDECNRSQPASNPQLQLPFIMARPLVYRSQPASNPQPAESLGGHRNGPPRRLSAGRGRPGPFNEGFWPLNTGEHSGVHPPSALSPLPTPRFLCIILIKHAFSSPIH